ncbi:MAG: hypothetical protein CMO55_19740 [Verrucomicrobiales bacterium]|nr:hypothetical protein [Verrucomicrobiales bacterium]
MKSLPLVLGLFLTCSALSFTSCTPGSGGGSGGGGSSTGGSINDTAKYLAGMSGNTRSEFALSRNSAEWKAHQGRMDGLWGTHSGRRSHIKGFRSNLTGLTGPSVLFYPFGGPDYLHASALFPGARNYVLVGLEGTDSMPDLASLSASELNRGLGGIANSLKTVTGASYFITKDMRVDLSSTSLRGTLPLLLAQIARDGKSVSSVSAVGIDSGGHLTSRSAGAACPGWHVRAGGKNIYYFKEDLSNGGLGDRRLLKFVSSKGSPVTFVKSASYLLHQGSFSSVRDYIVNNSRGIVQDPSGVPYHYLKDSGMKINLYGNYQGPLSTFVSHHQSDLVTAYQNGTHPVKPMTFGLGYLLNPERACVIVARR